MIFLQQSINALWLGAVYSLFALGYALVFSVLGVLNLAHSAVFMWGAYFGWFAVTQLNLPLPLAGLIAALGAGIVGILLDLLAFTPLRKRNAPRISQLISSMGIALILVKIAQITFSAQPQFFAVDSNLSQPLPNLPFKITTIQALIFFIAIALMIILRLIIHRTLLGKAIRAVSMDSQTATILGVPVEAYYRFVFFLSGLLAGVAGLLYGLAFNNVIPFMGDAIALKGLTVIVLGGLGNIEGAVIAGFLVAALEIASIALGGSTYRDAIIFLLLIFVLLIRPQGLLGVKTTTRV
jgi:branched-chain amino acid transport system permease protein